MKVVQTVIPVDDIINIQYGREVSISHHGTFVSYKNIQETLLKCGENRASFEMFTVSSAMVLDISSSSDTLTTESQIVRCYTG